MAHVIIIINKLDALKAKVQQADAYLHGENQSETTAEAVDGWLHDLENDLAAGNTLAYEARMSEISQYLP